MSDFEKRVDAICLSCGVTKDMRMEDNLKVMLHLLGADKMFIKDNFYRVIEKLELDKLHDRL